MTPLMIGLLWYFPTLFAFVILGIILITRKGEITKESALKGAKMAPGYAFLLVLVLLTVKAENVIQDRYHTGGEYTHLIYSIEGNTHIVYLQNLITNYYLLHTFSVIYLVTFLGIIVLTPIYLSLKGRVETLQLYTFGIVVNYAILVLFYLFFNVDVTSNYPPGTPVKPLLYQNPMYLELVHLVDRPSDCFPSGHVAITFFTFLVALKSDRNPRYIALTGAVFALTFFTVLYLGIHWILDSFSGMALGYFAYYAAGWGPVKRRLKAVVDRVNRIVINTEKT